MWVFRKPCHSIAVCRYSVCFDCGHFLHILWLEVVEQKKHCKLLTFFSCSLSEPLQRVFLEPPGLKSTMFKTPYNNSTEWVCLAACNQTCFNAVELDVQGRSLSCASKQYYLNNTRLKYPWHAGFPASTILFGTKKRLKTSKNCN